MAQYFEVLAKRLHVSKEEAYTFFIAVGRGLRQRAGTGEVLDAIAALDSSPVSPERVRASILARRSRERSQSGARHKVAVKGRQEKRKSAQPRTETKKQRKARLYQEGKARSLTTFLASAVRSRVPTGKASKRGGALPGDDPGIKRIRKQYGEWESD